MNGRDLCQFIWQINLAGFVVIHGQHFAAFLHTCTAFIFIDAVYIRAHILMRHDDILIFFKSQKPK